MSVQGSYSVIRRCRLNVRFARKRTSVLRVHEPARNSRGKKIPAPGCFEARACAGHQLEKKRAFFSAPRPGGGGSHEPAARGVPRAIAAAAAPRLPAPRAPLAGGSPRAGRPGSVEAAAAARSALLIHGSQIDLLHLVFWRQHFRLRSDHRRVSGRRKIGSGGAGSATGRGSTSTTGAGGAVAAALEPYKLLIQGKPFHGPRGSFPPRRSAPMCAQR
jgi:hypothetical protein